MIPKFRLCLLISKELDMAVQVLKIISHLHVRDQMQILQTLKDTRVMPCVPNAAGIQAIASRLPEHLRSDFVDVCTSLKN